MLLATQNLFQFPFRMEVWCGAPNVTRSRAQPSVAPRSAIILPRPAKSDNGDGLSCMSGCLLNHFVVRAGGSTRSSAHARTASRTAPFRLGLRKRKVDSPETIYVWFRARELCARHLLTSRAESTCSRFQGRSRSWGTGCWLLRPGVAGVPAAVVGGCGGGGGAPAAAGAGVRRREVESPRACCCCCESWFPRTELIAQLHTISPATTRDQHRCRGTS